MAATNVIRLPGAARRKPANHRYAAQYKAAAELRRQKPWPGEHEHGPMRAQRIEAERLASIMLGIDQTPTMLIVHAMLSAMSDEQRQDITRQLANGAAAGRKPHVEAVTLIRTAKMTTGDQWDLMNAIDRLSGEDRL